MNCEVCDCDCDSEGKEGKCRRGRLDRGSFEAADTGCGRERREGRKEGREASFGKEVIVTRRGREAR